MSKVLSGKNKCQESTHPIGSSSSSTDILSKYELELQS